VIRRFFIDPASISGNHGVISDAEARHISTVLRLQPGTAVELFDGQGVIYQGRLHTVSKHEITVDILGHRIAAETNIELTLAQGLLKCRKMDFVVQKATELGVRTFQPLLTRYSENRENPKRRQERWQRIMLEACKQCNRPLPMQINPIVNLDQIKTRSYSAKIMPWEGEDTVPLPCSRFSENGPICLLIGPEGGFHEHEVEQARSLGFKTISLGPRILRAETAALTAVALVQFLAGSLGPA